MNKKKFTPAEIEAAIERYFAECGDKPTISGLAYACGFESRTSFYYYEDYPEYTRIIRRARLRVEMGYERRLHTNAPTGAIYALKMMGWETENQNASKEEIQIENFVPLKS